MFRVYTVGPEHTTNTQCHPIARYVTAGADKRTHEDIAPSHSHYLDWLIYSSLLIRSTIQGLYDTVKDAFLPLIVTKICMVSHFFILYILVPLYLAWVPRFFLFLFCVYLFHSVSFLLHSRLHAFNIPFFVLSLPLFPFHYIFLLIHFLIFIFSFTYHSFYLFLFIPIFSPFLRSSLLAALLHAVFQWSGLAPDDLKRCDPFALWSVLRASTKQQA
jgi:hypothetical protein